MKLASGLALSRIAHACKQAHSTGIRSPLTAGLQTSCTRSLQPVTTAFREARVGGAAPAANRRHCASLHTTARALSANSAVHDRQGSSAIAEPVASSTDSGSDSTDPAEIMEVIRIPCLQDNYIWLLLDKNSGEVAVVDPSEAAPVIKVLEDRGLQLDYILNTHHHWDHTGGNLELKRRYKCQIAGPGADKDRIPGIDYNLVEEDVFRFGDIDTYVYDTPGHTRGHITLWMPEASSLFPGDTLFALGCGRLFEGTPEMMWHSLRKLLKLPRNATVYCAHEYTQSNARFAVTVDPDNAKLHARKEQIDQLRAQGLPTVPSLLGEELDTNPFLRPGDPAIRKHLGVSLSAPDEVAFAALRKAKDNF